MAQIKIYTFDDTDGETREHALSDDLTMATLTAATQIDVTSGPTITATAITFNAPASDTINGIIADNLLDRTSTSSITGQFTVETGVNLKLTDSPIAAIDAVNKGYLDGLIQNAKRKDNCLVATTANITLSGEQTIDGVATSTSRVLVWKQTAGAENGIYVSGAGAWTRTLDSDTGVEILGSLMKVLQGTLYGQHNFNNSNSTAPTVGSTAITYVNLGESVVHNSLLDLQGGNGSDEYYHITAAENTFVGAAITKATTGGAIVANDVDDTLSADYGLTGLINAAAGDFVLPTTDMAVPVSGAVDWDESNSLLRVYSSTGAKYITFDPSGEITEYTAGVGGITAGQIVYISANDTILPADANNFDESKGVAGIAINTASAASEVRVIDTGVALAALSGATFNTIYYLSETAGALTTTPPTTSGASVVRIGNAKNATDLHMRIKFIVKRR
jgi:hypothetical protein